MQDGLPVMGEKKMTGDVRTPKSALVYRWFPGIVDRLADWALEREMRRVREAVLSLGHPWDEVRVLSVAQKHGVKDIATAYVLAYSGKEVCPMCHGEGTVRVVR